MDPSLTLKGVIALGNLRANIVEDAQGRQCMALTLGDREVLFTISQALMIRELLDAGIAQLTHYEPLEAP